MRTIQRKELYNIEQELIALQQTSPALTLLLKDKINLFVKKNEFHLKVMRARFREIQSKYIQKDPQGNFMTEGEGDSKQWKFVDKLDDLVSAQVLDVSQVEKKYEEECEKFFTQSVQLDW